MHSREDIIGRRVTVLLVLLVVALWATTVPGFVPSFRSHGAPTVTVTARGGHAT